MSFSYEFERASNSVDIIIINHKLEVLLIKRGHEPGKDLWALPGGHINPREEPIEAARRELEEETDLIGVPLTLFDVRNGEDSRGWYVKTIYHSNLRPLRGLYAGIKAGDDAVDFKWEDLKKCGYPQSRKFLYVDHQRILADFYMCKY